MKVDRSVLLVNDQSSGQIASPDKLESSIEHLANTIDTNDNQFNSHKNNEELDHPDKSVTEKKLGDRVVSRRTIGIGAVGYDELDKSLLEFYDDIAVTAKLNEHDDKLTGCLNLMQYKDLRVAVANGYDWSPAVQMAVDEAERLGIKKVKAPAGEYLLKSVVKIPYKDFDFGGEGTSTIFKLDTDIRAFECIGLYDSSLRIKNTTLHDFAIKGLENTGTGIYLEYFTLNCKLKNIFIDEVKTGIHVGQQCYGSIYERMVVNHFTTYGMYIGRASHLVQVKNSFFSSWRKDSAKGYNPKGVILWGGDNTLPAQAVRFQGCDFEGCNRGLEVTGGDGLVVESCYFENNFELHMRLGNSADYEELRNYRISNCWFDGVPVIKTTVNSVDYYECIAISVDGSKIATTGGTFENLHFGFSGSQNDTLSTDSANPTKRGIKADVYGTKKPPILINVDGNYFYNFARTYSNACRKPIVLTNDAPVSVPLESGVANVTNKELRVYKQLNIVYMEGAITIGALGKIGTLPPGYTPKHDQSRPITCGQTYDATQTLGILEIKRDGTLYLRGGDTTKPINLNLEFLSDYRFDLV